MSRRTRLRRTIQKPHAPSVHHQSYAMSESPFPSAFSRKGDQIRFPAKIGKLFDESKINFVGQMEELIQLNDIPLQTQQNATYVCLSIKGKLKRAPSNLNSIIFYASLPCICLIPLLSLSFIRKKTFPLYQSAVSSQLAAILSRFPSIHTLVLNIQDNYLTQQKIAMIQTAILQSNAKVVIVRNLAYYMGQKIDTWFNKIAAKSDINFVFLWQSKRMKKDRQRKEEVVMSFQQSQGTSMMPDSI